MEGNNHIWEIILEKIIEKIIDIFFEKTGIGLAKKRIKNDKLSVLRNKECDKSYQYNETILKNFVPRKFKYYGTKKIVSVKKIKAEIKNRKYFQKNIILTGVAGVGKSTVLKWLFLNTNISNCRYIYIYAQQYDKCRTLDEVLKKIAEDIPDVKRCVIFFDGLDELKCIKGNEYEFNKLINFFDCESKTVCKFVISTRPEHFGFNNMIIKNNSEVALDNYAIFELQKLSPRESYKICKSIKKLYYFDKKYNLNNFINKWPSKETEEKKEIHLSEKEYIKALKKYLNNMDEGNSLLSIPILCRYAYQIICGWSLEGQNFPNYCNKNKSDKVKSVLEYYIKWEFHDTYKGQTKNTKGKMSLYEYTNRVIDFLTDLAGTMKDEKFIDREQWGKLKKEKIKEINESFCVLQEIEEMNEKEKLCFVHNTFQDYFLARYYVLMPEDILAKDEECDKFVSLLRTNSEFALMYIEQLINGKNELAKKICVELLELENNDIEKVTEYAKGSRRFIYTPEISFTVEEYLTVFPGGTFLYLGNIFNRHIWNKRVTDCILELNSVEYLTQYNDGVMTKGSQRLLKGLEIKLSNIEYLMEHFYIYSNGVFHRVYRLNSILRYGVIRNTSDLKKEQKFNLKKEQEFNLKKEQEFNVVYKTMSKMVEFLGEEEKYWCMFDDNTIFVYQMFPQNERKMSELFRKKYIEDHVTYITCYGCYRAMIENEEEFAENSLFYKTDDVSFVFNENSNVIKNNGIILKEYYAIHLLVIRLLECKSNSVYICVDAPSLYMQIEKMLEVISNDKLRLYFFNEQILILYALEDRERMVNLARETINLCRLYNHKEGIELREFVMSKDISFKGKDLEKVYEFEKDYIWM